MLPCYIIEFRNGKRKKKEIYIYTYIIFLLCIFRVLTGARPPCQEGTGRGGEGKVEKWGGGGPDFKKGIKRSEEYVDKLGMDVSNWA